MPPARRIREYRLRQARSVNSFAWSAGTAVAPRSHVRRDEQRSLRSEAEIALPVLSPIPDRSVHRPKAFPMRPHSLSKVESRDRVGSGKALTNAPAVPHG